MLAKLFFAQFIGISTISAHIEPVKRHKTHLQAGYMAFLIKHDRMSTGGSLYIDSYSLLS